MICWYFRLVVLDSHEAHAQFFRKTCGKCQVKQEPQSAQLLYDAIILIVYDQIRRCSSDSDSYSGFLLLIREVLGAAVGSLGAVLAAISKLQLTKKKELQIDLLASSLGRKAKPLLVELVLRVK